LDGVHHLRRQNRFMPILIDRLLTQSNIEIAKKVNEDKDALSKALPGIYHRMYKHGLGSNIEYLFRYGLRGLKAGIQHDLDDLRHTLGTPNKTKFETIFEIIRIRRKRFVMGAFGHD